MPVEPIPCAPGGGTGTPGACACAPSIATSPMCRADGTSVLLVVRSECVDCGDPAAAPAVVGWIDPSSGVFTPGAAPADVGPCETPGCVETICVTRCDDTDGDGAADATYSELWCVRADGTTSLVLTYQGEPSTPYVPVSPVECTHGCPDDETVMLCDLRPDGSSVPFLRRYVFLNGAGSFEDVALDGQTPHVVLGTVGVCPVAAGCDSPTTPVATVGLCLPGGVPIAVVLTRGCDGVTSQTGWINLTTGLFTAGDPPPGARACGDSRAFELTGVLCDTDPATGDVLGLVLVQYAYNPDGSLASVELLNPADGSPYLLQGELRVCPGGEELPEQDLAVLCDVQDDGTSVPFLRDWRRDTAGAVTGYTDYTLAGMPYTPTGTVGICAPAAEPCRDTTTMLLCDLDTSGAHVVPGFTDVTDQFARDGVTIDWEAQPGGGGPLWAGGSIVMSPDSTTDNGILNRWRTVAAALTAPRPGCDSGTATVTVSVTPERLGPQDACQNSGRFDLWVGDTIVASTAPPQDTPVGWSGELALTASVPAAELAAGRVFVVLGLETYQRPDPAACGGMSRSGGWEVSGFSSAVDFDQGGCASQFLRHIVTDCETGQVVTVTDTTLDGDAYEVTGDVAQCTAATGGECCPQPPPETRLDVETGPLCLVDDATGTVLGRVLAERVYDDQTGQRVAQRLVDPATGDPVEVPAGASLGMCEAQAEPCRNASTLLVCDLPTGGTPVATVTDTSPVPYTDMAGVNPVAGGAAALWSGGTLTIPPDTAPAPDGHAQHARTFAATVQAPRPGCDTGTATVTASIRVERDGPDAGCAGTGVYRLMAGGTVLSSAGVAPPSVPVGTVQTLTVTAQVPAADLAAGSVALVGVLETYHRAPGSCPGGSNGDGARIGGWTVDESTVEVVYDQTGCATQIMRTVTTDCETGAVVSVTDTTMDGQPYTPTGEVGQCTTAGGQCCPPEPCRDTSTVLLCDLPTGGTPQPAVTDRDPAPYYPYPTGVPVAGAQALWDGGTLDLPPGTGPQPGTTGSVNILAATVQAPRPVCDTGTARVAVSVNVQQTGPDDGCGSTGHLRLFNGSTQAALTVLPGNTPNGYFGTLTVEADVPAADLAAGSIAVALALDAYDDSGGICPGARSTGWILSAFTPAIAYDQEGCATQILRTLTTDCETGAVLTVTDTTLDGVPYTPVGEVGQCAAAGGGPGTAPVPEPCPAQQVIEACRCDDTDGDGLPDVGYVELLAVDCDGVLTSIGTYTDGLTGPYSPVAPVDCDAASEDEGAPLAYGVQARRVELAPGESWSPEAWPTLQSVTAVAHGGTGTITTTDGASTLHVGESASWSVARDEDAALTGPLLITADTGAVTINFTTGVAL